MEKHSAWVINKKLVAGKEFYQVCRIIDTSKPYYSENVETRGGLYDSIRDAKALARHLNTEEAVK